MRQNTIISTGVGNHQMMTAQFYRWTTPKQMLTSGSLGTGVLECLFSCRC